MAESPRTRFAAPDRRREIRRLLASALLMGLMGVIALVYLHPWTARPALRVAVARFDNETGSKDYDRFADALTRSVAAELSRKRPFFEGSTIGTSKRTKLCILPTKRRNSAK